MAIEIYNSAHIGKSESKRRKLIWQVEKRVLPSGTENQPRHKEASLGHPGKPVGQSVQAMLKELLARFLPLQQSI